MRNNFINVVSFTPKGKGHSSVLVMSSMVPSPTTSSEGWEKKWELDKAVCPKNERKKKSVKNK